MDGSRPPFFSGSKPKPRVTLVHLHRRSLSHFKYLVVATADIGPGDFLTVTAPLSNTDLRTLRALERGLEDLWEGLVYAGPLVHLAEIDSLELLSTFDTLLVPETVYEESTPVVFRTG